MLRRRTEERPAEASAAIPAPPAPDSGVPKCLEPSNFASRRAQAEVNKAILSRPALVHIGQAEHTQVNHKTRRFETRTVELFCEKAHPSRRYFKMLGADDHPANFHKLFDDTTPPPEPERFSGPLRKPDSSAWPDSGRPDERRPLGTSAAGQFGRPRASAYAETTYEEPKLA